MALAWAHGARLADNLRRPQWEDQVFFRYTRDHLHTLLDCFRLPGPYPGLYRPLTTNLFYFIGQRVFGESVFGYHLILVVFVVLNAVLLYRIASRMVPGWAALLAPLLWASRLANVEVVTHTCEFQGLFSAFWALLSLDWFGRDRRLPSNLAFALALLSKETALVLPAIFVAHHLAVERKPLRAFVGPLVIAAVFLGLSAAAIREPTGFSFDPSASNLLGNLATYLLSFSNAAVRPLDNWIMPASIVRLSAHRSMQAAVAILVALDLVGLLRGGRARIVAFGFAWFVLATLPVAMFRDRLFMRYAYLGHAGLSVAACAALALAVDMARARRTSGR